MAAPQEPAWRPQWMSPLCSRSAGACMLARPELLQQPHVPIEETGQTRGIAWHQTAVNDRTGPRPCCHRYSNPCRLLAQSVLGNDDAAGRLIELDRIGMLTRFFSAAPK